MEDTSAFATVALPIALALIMGTLGLSLTVEDFKRIFTQPRGLAIGLANLLVLSPLLAFGIAELYGLEAVFAVGLVLLGASPGGTMANLLTHLARGETALSISMTAISSLAAAVTVPLYLGLAIEYFDAPFADDVNMAGIVARVFLITVVPLAIGMRVRARRTEWAIANEPRLKRAALVAFLFVVVAAVASEWGTVTEHFTELAIATLTLNVLAMAGSFTISRLVRLDNRQATAVAMELGIHNSTLAIAVATLISDDLAIPAAVYSAFMFLTAGAFARMMYARNGGAGEGLATAPAAAR
ncbi:MAG TPA: bile acid:sodium symporter family protein [Solirubrobacteraceae bacterium]|nr:bile acid:sodium symporter family protein [Solirubrobacteraceae bacterium]